MKHFLKETIKIIAILAIAIPTFAFLAGSWNEPVQSPPGTNVDAPINVGVQAQTKEGGLWLNTLGAAVGLIVEKGNVGIGTVNPGEMLEVAGSVKSNILYVGEICLNGDCRTNWPSGGGGGSGLCPPGQDSVDFGGASICLSDGATASASCTNTVVGPDNTSAYVYVLSETRYISINGQGQIQTKLFVSSGNNIIACDSGWQNSLTASITFCNTNSNGDTFESRFSGSSQTSSNGVSGNGIHYKTVYLGDGQTQGLNASCSTPTGAWQ